MWDIQFLNYLIVIAVNYNLQIRENKYIVILNLLFILESLLIPSGFSTKWLHFFMFTLSSLLFPLFPGYIRLSHPLLCPPNVFFDCFWVFSYLAFKTRVSSKGHSLLGHGLVLNFRLEFLYYKLKLAFLNTLFTIMFRLFPKNCYVISNENILFYSIFYKHHFIYNDNLPLSKN